MSPPTSSSATHAETSGSDALPPRPAHARPRVILADDHILVAAGVRGLLEPGFDVTDMVTDGEALIEAAHRLRPDLVIADISMPLRNGIEAIREIRKELPKVLAICLTMHADRMYLAEALEAGASGFVVKHAAAEELREAIHIVLGGGTYISPLVGGHTETFARHDMPFRLTPRQRQVLQLVAEGHTVKEVARMLRLAPKTVEFHKYRIMEDLGLTSSAELVQFAVEHGMVSRRPVPWRS